MSGDIVDNAVGLRLTPATAAMAILGRQPSDTPPMACCPRDDEPLIMTMERRGAEFVCMVCGTWYGFLAPKPLAPTPELMARLAELQARFDAGERP